MSERTMRIVFSSGISNLVEKNSSFDSGVLRVAYTEYAVDVLEEKCYAIRGRNGTAAKFSVEPKSPKLVVEKTSVTPEPYGGVFTEYGIASRNQHN